MIVSVIIDLESVSSASALLAGVQLDGNIFCGEQCRNLTGKRGRSITMDAKQLHTKGTVTYGNGAPRLRSDMKARAFDTSAKPIWEEFDEILAGVPKEELDKLPVDAVEKLDHYLYNSPGPATGLKQCDVVKIMITNPYMMPNPSVLSVSGGRTSGFMLHEIIKAHGGELPPWVIPVFANTGKECNETLDFVDQLSKQWNVRIRWVEYRYEPGLNTFVEVDYASASRNGEPFAMAIAARHFLPNPVTRFCTYELKVKTINRFARQTLKFEKYHDAVGLRADEPKRIKKLVKSDSVIVEQGLFGSRKIRLTRPEPGITAICPLASADVTLETVTEFWKNSPFDLQIRSDQGNCDLCFLKGAGKIVKLMQERPESAAWWIEQEQKIITDGTGATFRSDRPSYAELFVIANEKQDGPGWLWADEQDGSCGETTECRCTD